MTQINNLTTQPINKSSLAKRMLLGAGIGLVIIAFFVFQVENPNPEWGKLWMIRPLIIVPLAGAAGGAFYYYMNQISNQGRWKKILATILSLIVFIIGLWLGIILGLSGTLWD